MLLACKSLPCGLALLPSVFPLLPTRFCPSHHNNNLPPCWPATFEATRSEHWDYNSTLLVALHTTRTSSTSPICNPNHFRNQLTMADWQTVPETAAAVNGFDGTANGATNGTLVEANGDVDTQLATATSAFSLEEKAQFEEKAKGSGWGLVPANHNHHQTGDELQYAVYEWAEDYGEVGPRHEALEQQLFGGDFRMKSGNHIKALEMVTTVEGPLKVAPVRSFDKAGLHPVLEETITQFMGYTRPTPIQAYTIPALLQGNDVIAIAQTGSGKTAAYLVPIISRLMGKARILCAPRPLGPNQTSNRVRAEPLVVIVVPTHELAIQVFDECRRICYRSMLRPCAAYGGLPMRQTLDNLGKGCDILIGTTGRLCDLMNRPGVLSMSRVIYTVIDEADEMLNGDWEEELGKIMAGGDTNDDGDHAYLMFSATFPKELRKLARKYMAGEHYQITVGRAGSSHMNIEQDVIYVDSSLKLEACYDLLLASPPVRTLIFCNSKKTVDELDAYLYQRLLPTTSIHSDRGQMEREDAMRAFRTGAAPIMITSGITARGLDVAGIEHVINYDLPSTMHGGITEYVHRIGRTARIGHKGKATSFYNEQRNEEIGPDLVRHLLENRSVVPDFLSHFAPEDGVANFDDDVSDDDEEDGDGVALGHSDGSAPALTAGSAWGANADTDATNTASAGFTADADASAPATSAW
ncbi:hypothetical protein Q7P37_006410 [Cladosporium fusiforme]